jgi:N-acetyl-alpha-D-muramate 1-phosphate uridylyltransferase
MTPGAVMIFGAGLGTRMGSLTRDRPKPLITAGGKALIDHALDLTRPVAPDRIVINLHYRAEQMRSHLAGRGVLFSDETDLLRETGGGLRHALPFLGHDPVYTLNSDAVWTGQNPLIALGRAWGGPETEALVHLVRREDATGFVGAGDFHLDASGRVRRGTGYVYTGAQIMRTEGLMDFEEPVFSLNRLWDRMMARGGLFGVVHDGGWCDVGRPESLPLAEALLARGHV